MTGVRVATAPAALYADRVTAVIEDAGREFAATVAAGAVRGLRDRMQAVVADLLGQALAIQDAARGPEISTDTKRRAAARAGGIRDAARQMQETLRRETVS